MLFSCKWLLVVKSLVSYPRFGRQNKLYNFPFQFDYSLVLLLVVILLFNPDYNPMLTRSVVTTLQSKYVTLLQRYIR